MSQEELETDSRVVSRRQVLTALSATGGSLLGGCLRFTGTEQTTSSQTSQSRPTSKTSPPPETASSTKTPTPSRESTASPTDTLTPQQTTAQTTTQPPTTQTATTPQPPAQRAKLAASDGDSRDFFGRSVALSPDGSTALVGASFDEDPNGDEAGSAYVFETAAGTWRQQAKLTPNDGDPEDEFGETVALSADGSTAVIGAVQDEHPNGTGDAGAAGSAYVFTNSDGAWRQQAKLAPTDGDAGDWFASSVAVSNDGTTAIIGAVNDDDPNGDHAGSAYVFTQSDGTWRQQAKLAATDGDNSDNFGRSVALSDDGSTALIGTPEDDDPNNGGSAYVFAEATGSWRQQAKLTAQDGDRGDTFGEAVAVSGDGSTALVGARLDEDPNGYRAGSAYVFEQASDSWTQAAKLTADDGDDRDWFGEAVKLSSDGSTALIGAQNDEDPNGSTESYSPGAGSAYVFAVADGSWSQSEKLAAEDGDGDDDFGKAVALAGDGATALIGAPQDENPNGSLAGSAYVFAL